MEAEQTSINKKKSQQELNLGQGGDARGKKNRTRRIRRSLILKSKLERKWASHQRAFDKCTWSQLQHGATYSHHTQWERSAISILSAIFTPQSQTSFRQVHASVCIWDAPSATFNRDLIRVSTSLDSTIISSQSTCQKRSDKSRSAIAYLSPAKKPPESQTSTACPARILQDKRCARNHSVCHRW